MFQLLLYPMVRDFFLLRGQRELAFISNSLYYLSYNSLGVNLEKLVLDEPVIL